MDQAVVDRLDTLIALFALAFHDQISSAVNKLRTDPVNNALLDLATEWVKSGDLQRNVIAATGGSPRTVQRRLAELASRQLLSSRGAGTATEYRTRSL